MIQKKKSELSDWFNELENRFIKRIISIDKTIAELWGFTQARLEKEGKSMPVIDGLIACSALSNGLAVVTRNGKDMIMSGVEIINPWS